jgi:hypothetical protein
LRNYPYLWFKNISRLLEKREFHIANIFLFALFVGSFRRFLEWTLGGVPEPFPLNFIVTLTGFYWFAFFLITLILKLLIAQPWRMSMNVILVGIFLGIFPPIIDLIASGPGFQYGYVWEVPAQFNWYLYNPALKIPIGEAIVLWAVILLTTTYVRYKTRSWWRTLAALVLAYAGVLILGGVLAGSARILARVLGWQPTQQIILLNLLQILVPFAIYFILQPRVAKALAWRLPPVALYLAAYFAGAWLTGGISITVLGYAALVFVFLVIGQAQAAGATVGGPDGSRALDQEDTGFFYLTGGLLLGALAAGNALMFLPLLLCWLAFPAGKMIFGNLSAGVARVAFSRSLVIGGSFAAGAVAAMEHAGYGGPRWWIAFLPDARVQRVVEGLDGLTLGVLAALVAGAVFLSVAFHRKGANEEMGGGPLRFAIYAVLLALTIGAAGRLFLDWALRGEYPTLMLISLLILGGRYLLVFLTFGLLIAKMSGTPWRQTMGPAAGFGLLGVLPPFVDALFGTQGALYRLNWQPPASWSPTLIYTAQGVTAGEAILWWGILLLSAGYVFRITASGLRAAATLVVGYLAITVLSIYPAVSSEWLRASLGWPEEHRIAILAGMQFIAAFLVYLALEPRLLRGLAGRIPHVLPFVLICVLGSAFWGSVTTTTWAYAFFLALAGWLALGQNDYFDAKEDAAQNRKAYLDLEDVRFLTVISWIGVATMAAAHAGVTFLAAMAAVAYMLYNYPFYRGKHYFPTNLKIEGIWGFCAFSFGLVAAWEAEAYGAPRWWVTNSPPLADPVLRGPFDIASIVAMFLAFGGFSLVALLKDYKDWQSDHAAGVGTLYTLAIKKGWRFERVHRIALTICCVAIASAPFLMTWAGRTSWGFAPGGLLAGGLVWVLMLGPASAARFRLTLLALTVYFVYLIVALGW